MFGLTLRLRQNSMRSIFSLSHMKKVLGQEMDRRVKSQRGHAFLSDNPHYFHPEFDPGYVSEEQ